MKKRKPKTNVSISEQHVAWAKELMALRGLHPERAFTRFLEELIFEEYEFRHGRRLIQSSKGETQSRSQSEAHIRETEAATQAAKTLATPQGDRPQSGHTPPPSGRQSKRSAA